MFPRKNKFYPLKNYVERLKASQDKIALLNAKIKDINKMLSKGAPVTSSTSSLSDEIFLINTQISLLKDFVLDNVRYNKTETYPFMLTLASLVEKRADLHVDYVSNHPRLTSTQKKRSLIFADKDYYDAMTFYNAIAHSFTPEECERYLNKRIDIHFSRIQIRETIADVSPQVRKQEIAEINNYAQTNNLRGLIEEVRDPVQKASFVRLLRAHLYSAKKRSLAESQATDTLQASPPQAEKKARVEKPAIQLRSKYDARLLAAPRKIHVDNPPAQPVANRRPTLS